MANIIIIACPGALNNYRTSRTPKSIFFHEATTLRWCMKSYNLFLVRFRFILAEVDISTNLIEQIIPYLNMTIGGKIAYPLDLQYLEGVSMLLVCSNYSLYEIM